MRTLIWGGTAVRGWDIPTVREPRILDEADIRYHKKIAEQVRVIFYAGPECGRIQVLRHRVDQNLTLVVLRRLSV